jgi:putative transposase
VQASVQNRTFGCIRVVWNRTLAWLNEVSSVPLQQAIRHQQSAYAAFLAKRARYRDGVLYLAKMGAPLAFNWSWPEVDPATIDPSTVKDFAVTSDQQRIPNPRHLERRARNLARCQQGSANRVKAKAKAARAHRKVRAARTDFLHKTSIRLVSDHDLIVLEDLAVQNMARNRAVARAIGDCGWGIFRAMLEYKAAWYGRHVIVIDRWFPSSKMCSACGYVLADLGPLGCGRPRNRNPRA